MIEIIKKRYKLWLRTAVFLLALTACTARSESPVASRTPAEKAEAAAKYDEYTIVTLLPRDAIPAIDNPEFYSPEEAGEFYAPDELIIGVEFEGDARAYSVPFLSGHEIVNDTVGDHKIAVTW